MLFRSVGIGTTNPTHKLEIVGHCITGDTLLAIRRRKRKRKKKKEKIGFNDPPEADQDEDEYEYEYLLVPIKDILPGDEVLSLDQSSNKAKYHRIKALLDMGTQDVYEIRTKSGRIIRTTAEHPYLVKTKVKN